MCRTCWSKAGTMSGVPAGQARAHPRRGCRSWGMSAGGYGPSPRWLEDQTAYLKAQSWHRHASSGSGDQGSALLVPPSDSHVEVSDNAVSVRMGWAFNASVPSLGNRGRCATRQSAAKPGSAWLGPTLGWSMAPAIASSSSTCSRCSGHVCSDSRLSPASHGERR